MPASFAIMVAIQFVASPGGSVCERATTRAAMSAPSGGTREGACHVTQQTLDVLLHEAFLPAPDAGRAGLVHDLIGAESGCAQQDDLSPPHLLLRHIAIPHDASNGSGRTE